MPRLLPLAVLALLAGCGQKGPLFLPAAPATASPAAAPGSAAGEAAAPAIPSPESDSRERATPAQP